MGVPWGELLSGIQLLILVFLTIRAIGERRQLDTDAGVAQGHHLARHEKQLATLDDRVQALREIRIADRLSRLESMFANLETHLREEFVTKDVCAGRMR